jgi:hypothetical protein
MVQQYSLNTQTEFAKNFLLEIGYVGSRGTHLNRGRGSNQALLASPSNPIRGVTTNTVANVRQRVPFLGFQPTTIEPVASDGESWYNSLQTSLTKRLSKGLQTLTSYTWSKTLDLNGDQFFGNSRGRVGSGDRNVKKQGYGPADISRAHRLVFSYTYELPRLKNRPGLFGKLAGGWSVSGVTLFQTGNMLTFLYTNGTNATGITTDRAQLAPGCTHDDLVTSGRTQDRLNKYFNDACFTTPPVIGSDGRATAFGNSGVSIATGPGQFNTDMSIVKKFLLGSDENRRMEFRAEFFNLFNTPQFSNPDSTFGSSTFGQISSTSVNPRFVQFALRLNF